MFEYKSHTWMESVVMLGQDLQTWFVETWF